MNEVNYGNMKIRNEPKEMEDNLQISSIFFVAICSKLQDYDVNVEYYGN